jgi:hypothetical protein
MKFKVSLSRIKGIPAERNFSTFALKNEFVTQPGWAAVVPSVSFF